MRLYDNDFKEIQGFTKDEILDVKKDLTKFQTDNAEQVEIDDYLKEKFHLESVEMYKTYVNDIREFYTNFLQDGDTLKSKDFYFHLKSVILTDLQLISDSSLNIKQNGRNTKRFLKQNSFLDDLLKEINIINESSSELLSLIKGITKKTKNEYDDKINIWLQINRIKNDYLKVHEFPNELKIWDDMKELLNFIAGIDKNDSEKKKKKKKKEEILPIQFQTVSTNTSAFL